MLNKRHFQHLGIAVDVSEGDTAAGPFIKFSHRIIDLCFYSERFTYREIISSEAPTQQSRSFSLLKCMFDLVTLLNPPGHLYS